MTFLGPIREQGLQGHFDTLNFGKMGKSRVTTEIYSPGLEVAKCHNLVVTHGNFEEILEAEYEVG